MDGARARRIADELTGRPLGRSDWEVVDYVNHGKSAVVLRGKRPDGTMAALKVFDPELVEKYGRSVQLERIHRELGLQSVNHPNLVTILDGGECPRTQYLYVAMAMIDYPNLASTLTSVPREAIWTLISQVAAAAQFLETLDLAHRDIKPDNIAVSPDFSSAILLDLGVLRPIPGSTLTDEEERRTFIGTLQYSSPELLTRTEQDGLDAWRAITFYQLGAVLYDLIARCRIFSDRMEPYARLVEAVLHEEPVLDAGDVPSDLLLLTKCCLLKDPTRRLALVNWDSFRPRDSRDSSRVISAQERIRKRQALAEFEASRDSTSPADAGGVLRLRRAVENMVATLEQEIRTELLGGSLPRVPPLTITKSFADLVYQFAAAQLLIVFQPSAIDALRFPLAVWFDLSILSESDSVVRIRYAGVLSASTPDTEQALPFGSHATLLFEGPMEPRSLRARLRDLLLPMLDEAMEWCQKGAQPSRDGEWIVISPARGNADG